MSSAGREFGRQQHSRAARLAQATGAVCCHVDRPLRAPLPTRAQAAHARAGGGHTAHPRGRRRHGRGRDRQRQDRRALPASVCVRACASGAGLQVRRLLLRPHHHNGPRPKRCCVPPPTTTPPNRRLRCRCSRSCTRRSRASHAARRWRRQQPHTQVCAGVCVCRRGRAKSMRSKHARPVTALLHTRCSARMSASCTATLE
jgi:hypothetical protein